MPSHHPSLLLTPQRLLQTFAAALEGSRFIEVIGIVRDAETIEMVRFVRMGDDVGESDVQWSLCGKSGGLQQSQPTT